MTTTKHETVLRVPKEWIVSVSTLAIIVLTVATYYFNLDKSNWLSGPILLLMEIFAIALQGLFTCTVWKSKNQNIKTLLAIISIGLLSFIVWSFYNFMTKTS